jgi:hypothetical protein
MGLAPKAHLAPGDPVERDLDGLWFFGRVFEVKEDCVSLVYEDGNTEEGVPFGDVRSCAADGRLEDWKAVTAAVASSAADATPLVQSKYEGDGRYELEDGSVLVCHSDQLSTRAVGGSGARLVRWLKSQQQSVPDES